MPDTNGRPFPIYVADLELLLKDAMERIRNGEDPDIPKDYVNIVYAWWKTIYGVAPSNGNGAHVIIPLRGLEEDDCRPQQVSYVDLAAIMRVIGRENLGSYQYLRLPSIEW